jgi:predicted AlkP superfamily pyrophosphatase or phosphodiesterase
MSAGMRASRRALAPAAALVLLLGAAAAPAGRQAPRPSGPPRLLVVLVVDQFRADYVDRFGHEWTGGLRRLLDGGARFPLASYSYFSTVTCAGHATIGTGSFPAVHGMVLNEWWDRAKAADVACTDDDAARPVSYGAPMDGVGDSAATLRVPTLADELRAQRDPDTRVLAFSLKARSSATLAGQRGDAVVWFDDRGAWVTSTAYTASPVPAVSAFVKQHPVDADVGRLWDRLLPADRYLFESPAVGVRPGDRMTPAFPHVVGQPGQPPDAVFYAQWQRSPFADAYLASMGLDVAAALGAGSAEGRTDFLSLSFAVLDLVGHQFGPNSHEVQDVLLRLDGTIGELLDGLDRRVGAGRYVVALTSDHGVVPLPERHRRFGLPGGRLPTSAIAEAIDAVLAPLGPGRHVARIAYADAYLAGDTWAKLRERPDLIAALKARLVAMDGIEAVFTRDEIEADRFTGDSIGRQLARSYDRERSGDLLIALAPYWLHGSTGTTHGTGYGYDTRVPLLFMGPGFVPGDYFQAASPADLAPTLAYLAGITLPRAQGRVLSEALAGVR